MDHRQLTKADTRDSHYAATERNIEIAIGYGLRALDRWRSRIPAWMDLAEFEEAIILAVMRARDNYDPEHAGRGGKRPTWFTYAHAMVEGALMETERKILKSPSVFSLDEMVTRNRRDGACDDLRYIDIIRDEARDPAEQVEAREYLLFVFREVAPRVLERRDLEILYLRYVRGVKQKDVAIRYKLTSGRIHQIEDEAFEKIRLALGAG